MRDRVIINMVNNAMKSSTGPIAERLMLHERLIKEFTEQLGGWFHLLTSIPVIGVLIRKYINKKIGEYQEILEEATIVEYQRQKKAKEGAFEK